MWYPDAMIDFDGKTIETLAKDLSVFAHRALPVANGKALNAMAFDGRRTSQQMIKDKMITRNQWTVRSVQVETVRGFNIANQQSKVGSRQEYMRTQELGGEKVAKGREGVPIATSYSSGEGLEGKPRRRLPRRPNKLGRIKLRDQGNMGRSRRQRNLIAVRQAAASGDKYVFMDLGNRAGIFKVVGGKRRPQVRMVWDMSRKSVSIPKRKWLEPSVEQVIKRGPEHYIKALQQQARKHGLFAG